MRKGRNRIGWLGIVFIIYFILQQSPMTSREKQTVKDFLNPVRLITSTNKRSKVNKSYLSSKSPRNAGSLFPNDNSIEFAGSDHEKSHPAMHSFDVIGNSRENYPNDDAQFVLGELSRGTQKKLQERGSEDKIVVKPTKKSLNNFSNVKIEEKLGNASEKAINKQGESQEHRIKAIQEQYNDLLYRPKEDKIKSKESSQNNLNKLAQIIGSKDEGKHINAALTNSQYLEEKVEYQNDQVKQIPLNIGGEYNRQNSENTDQKKQNILGNFQLEEDKNIEVSRATNKSKESYSYAKKLVYDAPPKQREFSNKANSLEATTSDCNELLRKMVSVKEGLESEIAELAFFLDNTSKYFTEVDEEFLKIKNRVLDYTARQLDASFVAYKKNMVDWGKYEEEERKGELYLKELDIIVEQEGRELSELAARGVSNEQIVSEKRKELTKKHEYYRSISNDIRSSREQCKNMRPTLTKEKIRTFEVALAELTSF